MLRSPWPTSLPQIVRLVRFPHELAGFDVYTIRACSILGIPGYRRFETARFVSQREGDSVGCLDRHRFGHFCGPLVNKHVVEVTDSP